MRGYYDGDEVWNRNVGRKGRAEEVDAGWWLVVQCQSGLRMQLKDPFVDQGRSSAQTAATKDIDWRKNEGTRSVEPWQSLGKCGAKPSFQVVLPPRDPAEPDRSWKELQQSSRFQCCAILPNLRSRPLPTPKDTAMAASLGFGGTNVSTPQSLTSDATRSSYKCWLQPRSPLPGQLLSSSSHGTNLAHTRSLTRSALPPVQARRNLPTKALPRWYNPDLLRPIHQSSSSRCGAAANSHPVCSSTSTF
jgi:hypothetical protein